MNRPMLKDGSKYIKFINRRLFRAVLLKTVSLMIVLIFFTMLSLQIEEIKEERTLIFEDGDAPDLKEGTVKLVEKKVDFIRRPLLNCLDANDEYLAYVIGKDYLIPPVPDKNYMLKDQKRLELSSDNQAKDVMEMVYKNNLKNGFFVEAGAADCEFSSSLPLEHNFGWTGILIEAKTQYFHECKKVNRKAYLMNTCLGVERTPYFAKFNFESAGINNKTSLEVMAGFGDHSTTDKDSYYIQCFPLEAILAAIGRPKVNLFILDIEGYELAVLRAIDWTKVDIEVLTVEVEHAGVFMKDSSPTIIEEFMKDKGYKRFKHRNRTQRFQVLTVEMEDAGVFMNDSSPTITEEFMKDGYKRFKHRNRYHQINGGELDHLYVRNDIVQKYNVVQL